MSLEMLVNWSGVLSSSCRVTLYFPTSVIGVVFEISRSAGRSNRRVVRSLSPVVEYQLLYRGFRTPLEQMQISHQLLLQTVPAFQVIQAGINRDFHNPRLIVWNTFITTVGFKGSFSTNNKQKSMSPRKYPGYML